MDVYVCKIKENGIFENACVFDNEEQAKLFLYTNIKYYESVSYETFKLIEVDMED